jgi:hypothetical protein
MEGALTKKKKIAPAERAGAPEIDFLSRSLVESRGNVGAIIA